jgi:hypothetical protein
MHGSHVFPPTAPALLSCIACTTARSLLNYGRRFCLNFDPVSGIRTFRSDRWSVVEPTVWTNRASRAIPLPPRASPPYLTERKKERKTSLVRYSEFQFNSWHHTPPDSETRVLNQNFFGGGSHEILTRRKPCAAYHHRRSYSSTVRDSTVGAHGRNTSSSRKQMQRQSGLN